MFRLKIDAPESAALTVEQAEEVRAKSKQAMLALGMLIAGSANTITCKLTLSVMSPSTDGAGDEPKPFEHPFVMAGAMFFGECLCLVWFRTKEICNMQTRSPATSGKQSSKKLPFSAFALPAACDVMGTSIMYLGLTMTSASTYQMLRGSSIIFTALLSSIFLGRKQYGFHWFSMLLVVAGVLTVGVASALTASSQQTSGNPLLGNCLVVASQLAVAVQMCVEERFVTGYRVPALVAVGNEGVWGLSFLLASLIPLQHIMLNGRPMENSIEAVYQVRHTPKIIALGLSNSFSIAFFNFFGMSITKYASAAYRMMLDSLRTIIIWLFDMASGGGKFHPLQLLGFAFMLTGTAIYNEDIRVPGFYYPKAEDAFQRQAQSENSRTAPLLSSMPQEQLSLDFQSSPTMKVDDYFTPKLTRFTIPTKK